MLVGMLMGMLIGVVSPSAPSLDRAPYRTQVIESRLGGDSM